jgi:antirestriction protein ArdC
MFEKLKAEAAGQIQHQGDLKSHPAIDKMIDDNLFLCPISQVRGDRAFYSPSKDEIVVPTREQFIDGEAFATNTLHECAHATGAESRLNRPDLGHPFGSEPYGREELTAELSAAVVASQYGLSKHVKDDSAKYLKSWLGSLREGPEFLKSILSNVRRCSTMITQRIEAIRQEMDKGEKADYSQFQAGRLSRSNDAPDLAVQAAKETGDEQRQVGRSR